MWTTYEDALSSMLKTGWRLARPQSLFLRRGEHWARIIRVGWCQYDAELVRLS